MSCVDRGSCSCCCAVVAGACDACAATGRIDTASHSELHAAIARPLASGLDDIDAPVLPKKKQREPGVSLDSERCMRPHRLSSRSRRQSSVLVKARPAPTGHRVLRSDDLRRRWTHLKWVPMNDGPHAAGVPATTTVSTSAMTRRRIIVSYTPAPSVRGSSDPHPHRPWHASLHNHTRLKRCDRHDEDYRERPWARVVDQPRAIDAVAHSGKSGRDVVERSLELQAAEPAPVR